MTIYYDVSAAVHRHPGLGRYAESLSRALLAEHGDAMALVYYGDAAARLPAGLDGVPCRAIAAGTTQPRWGCCASRHVPRIGHLRWPILGWYT